MSLFFNKKADCQVSLVLSIPTLKYGDFRAFFIKSITLSLSKDIYVYDIVGYDDRKDCTIQVDATNNKILGQSTQVLDYDYEKDASLNLKKTISRQEANEIALKEFSGGTPISWELTDDNNQSIWEVKMIHGKHKHTVKINARTKAVI